MIRFKGIHKGKRFWLLASGPSLSDIDFTQVPDEDIIVACNSAVLKPHRLNYACFTDGNVMGFDYYHDLKNKDCTVIVFNEVEIFPIKEETYFIQKRDNRNDWKFSEDDTKVVFGIDVIHPTMNLCHVMGAREIILCGVDLHIQKGIYHWHDREKLVLQTNEHLRQPEGYFDWMCYDFGAEKNGFINIRKANPFLKITNANIFSKLNCFPKIPFKNIINAQSEPGRRNNIKIFW